MKQIVLFVCVLLLTCNSFAFDTPNKSTTFEKKTPENCKEFIKKEAQRLNKKDFKCRPVFGFGVVYACDNNLLHIELVCEESKSSVEEFKQNDSDWKKFYL